MGKYSEVPLKKVVDVNQLRERIAELEAERNEWKAKYNRLVQVKGVSFHESPFVTEMRNLSKKAPYMDLDD